MKVSSELHNLNFSVYETTIPRAVAKMALGLACKTLGPDYITSPGARAFREFLFEEDPNMRASRVPLGKADPFDNTSPKLTADWHPGGHAHLFALLSPKHGRIVFAANLFGSYELIFEVDNTGAFISALPDGPFPGWYWIVDPQTKRTTPPQSLLPLLLTIIQR